jgi:hypothetical protein
MEPPRWNHERSSLPDLPWFGDVVCGPGHKSRHAPWPESLSFSEVSIPPSLISPHGWSTRNEPMASVPPNLSLADWQRICDALRYLGRDLHHRSFAVSPERRELLWQEMDRCLALADRLAEALLEEPDTVSDLKVGVDAASPPGGVPSSTLGIR